MNEQREDIPSGRLLALDLFCGGGGAGMGLHRAGFTVTGIDINPQPLYPFKFIQGDALEADLDGFDLVWASPPCHAYSILNRNMHRNAAEKPDLLEATRQKLEEWGGPWIIENVKGSPVKTHCMLCGTMFGLKITRHRYFEANFDLPVLLSGCDHSNVYDPYNGPGRTPEKFQQAMGIDWLPLACGHARKRGVTGDLNNAIPPAFSEFLANHFLRANASR